MDTYDETRDRSHLCSTIILGTSTTVDKYTKRSWNISRKDDPTTQCERKSKSKIVHPVRTKKCLRTDLYITVGWCALTVRMPNVPEIVEKRLQKSSKKWRREEYVPLSKMFSKREEYATSTVAKHRNLQVDTGEDKSFFTTQSRRAENVQPQETFRVGDSSLRVVLFPSL